MYKLSLFAGVFLIGWEPMSEKSSPHEEFMEEEIFDLLREGLQGHSDVHYYKRVEGLEEIKRRAMTDSLADVGQATDILLAMASKYGAKDPESSLIAEILVGLIGKKNELFGKVLHELKGQLQLGRKPDFLFCFLRVAPHLDLGKKQQSVQPLVEFLMSRDALNDLGVDEVCKGLIRMSHEQTIRNEILKLIAPYLSSLKVTQAFFAVDVGSKIGDSSLTPDMLKAFERTFKHYYGGNENRMQQMICYFFRRVPDMKSLPFILKVVETNARSSEVLESLASLADAYPESLEEIYRFLEETMNPEGLLGAFTRMKEMSNLDFNRVLNATINRLRDPTIVNYLSRIAFGVGELAKPTLLRMAKSDDSVNYKFAVRCLNEIGVDFHENRNVFEESPVLRVSDFFTKGRKYGDIYQMWRDRIHLSDGIEGGDKFEYLVRTIFSAFNFVTLHVPTSKAVDIIAFSPTTFHLYIIGCTTTVPTEDIPKLKAIASEMSEKLTDISTKYEVIPVVFTTEKADFDHYKTEGVSVFGPEEIEQLLQMVSTGRKTKDLIDLLQSLRKH